MAAISTPGTARAARACVSEIFPPPMSPIYVAIYPSETHFAFAAPPLSVRAYRVSTETHANRSRRYATAQSAVLVDNRRLATSRCGASREALFSDVSRVGRQREQRKNQLILKSGPTSRLV